MQTNFLFGAEQTRTQHLLIDSFFFENFFTHKLNIFIIKFQNIYLSEKYLKINF